MFISVLVEKCNKHFTLVGTSSSLLAVSYLTPKGQNSKLLWPEDKITQLLNGGSQLQVGQTTRTKALLAAVISYRGAAMI